MNDFLNYPEPLYFELDNDYKKEILSLFTKLLEERKWLKLISIDSRGVVNVKGDVHVESFCLAFLFSKLDALGEVSDLYLSIDSKLSSGALQDILRKNVYRNFIYKPDMQKCLVKGVGGSLIFRNNDSDKLVIVS